VDGDESPVIKGYAAVFDKLMPIYDFKEKIRKGAFARTINNADIRALVNHDPNYVLGRRKSETLSLAEDEKGLAVEIKPPDVQWARDLMVSMRRGDISQMSFGFESIKDEWTDDRKERTLVEVKLFDVSVVTFPAYPQTSAKVRSILKNHGIIFESLAGALVRAERGNLLAEDEEVLQSSIKILRAIMPIESKPDPIADPASSHSGDIESDPARSHSPSWGRSLPFLKQRLHVLELETSIHT
jgi:HK97 family phage prohead protease